MAPHRLAALPPSLWRPARAARARAPCSPPSSLLLLQKKCVTFAFLLQGGFNRIHGCSLNSCKLQPAVASA